jgi:hypothetical protein
MWRWLDGEGGKERLVKGGMDGWIEGWIDEWMVGRRDGRMRVDRWEGWMTSW